MGIIRTQMMAFLLVLGCGIGLFVRMAMAQDPSSTYYNYQDLYETQWSGDHINMLSNGAQVQIVLDYASGAGFQSKNAYTYGFYSVAMKLVPGNSAGTVTAFFLSSGGDYHDEIDFEFLGNVSGQPYILQTNMFASGVGGREQRHYLWFDPTADFHTYGVIWNHAQVIYLVDNTPIRVFKNLQNLGLAYPSSQQTQAFSTLFQASSWATQGGNVPIDWSAAPFVATYGAFQIDGCINNGADQTACESMYQDNWWEGSAYTELSTSQLSDLQYIRNTYLVYDYCTDVARNPTPPTECSYNYS
ncbi:unnamed protein product [Calypogeia fissa]